MNDKIAREVRKGRVKQQVSTVESMEKKTISHLPLIQNTKKSALKKIILKPKSILFIIIKSVYPHVLAII